MILACVKIVVADQKMAAMDWGILRLKPTGNVPAKHYATIPVLARPSTLFRAKQYRSTADHTDTPQHQGDDCSGFSTARAEAASGSS